MSAKCQVIGALYRTWSLADEHSSDGTLDGYTADALDFAVGIDGWSEALKQIGWLSVESQRLIVPRFTEHNGTSAKRRADDATRKNSVRNLSAKCPQQNGQNADQNRIEKNRYSSSTKKKNSVTASPLAKRPTVEEVATYCDEMGYKFDPEKFVDFYTANGWVQGKNKPIKDWQAAVRNWHRNNDQFQKPVSKAGQALTLEELADWNPIDGGDG